MYRWILAVVFLTTLLLPLGPAALTAEAADDSIVLLSGTGGRLTAWPSQHRARVDLDGQSPIVFDNARILVRNTRVSVTARTNDRTLVAWGSRTTSSGAIGLIVRARDHRKRGTTYSVLVERVELSGEVATTRKGGR